MKIILFLAFAILTQSMVKRKLQYIQQTSFQKGKFNIGLLKDRLQVLGKELIDLKKELKEANEMLESNMTTFDNNNDSNLNNSEISVASVQPNNSSISDDSSTNKQLNNMLKRNNNQDVNQMMNQNLNKDNSMKKDEQNRQIMKMIQPQQVQEVNPKIQNEFEEINKTIEHNSFNFTSSSDDEHAKDLVIHIQKSDKTNQQSVQNVGSVDTQTHEQQKDEKRMKKIVQDQQKDTKKEEDNKKQEDNKKEEDKKEEEQHDSKKQEDNKKEEDKKEEQHDSKKEEQHDNKKEEEQHENRKLIKPRSPKIQMSSNLSMEQQEQKLMNDDIPLKFMNELDSAREDGHFMVLDKSRSEQIIIHMK